MGSLGWPEILMILVIALIIFGPRKLPELGKTIGQSLAQFRRASEDFKRTWEEEVEMEKRRIEAPPSPYEEPATAYQTDTAVGDSPPVAQDLNEDNRDSSNYWSSDPVEPQTEQAAGVETIEVVPTVTPETHAVPRQSRRDWL